MNPELFTPPSLSPLLQDILKLRGLESSEEQDAFLKPSLTSLLDPFLMKGMTQACERFQRAAVKGEKVLIHGDYDVDGITGAAVTAQTLQLLGIDFRVFLPDRAVDGYGVSKRAIEEAAAEGRRILVTVDCGITARAEIERARELGMDVIVLDHHRIPGEGLPPATVILNPLQEDCPYPFKELSAAGLAFKLAQALLGDRAFSFLDLAAISTVCDVAPLKEENRIIVKNGLKLLSKRTHLGLRALGEVAGMGKREVNVGHIGFTIGPRLNAAGRMSTPDIALRLLLSNNEKEAASLAVVLNEENKARQREERQTVKEAIRDVERMVNFNRDRVIVAAKQGWHQGVIGIVAARLVDKYHRPAVVIAVEDGQGKGSGRSIKTFNLYQALSACKDHFVGFGGHAQAAGLVIREDEIEAFRKKINEYAASEVSAESFENRIEIDLEVSLAGLTPQFLRELPLLEPHGAGNPRPVLLTRDVEVKTSPASLGYSRYQIFVTDLENVFEVQWTESEEAAAADRRSKFLKKGMRLDLYYSIKIKKWDGIERPILEAKEIRPLERPI